MAKKIRFPLEMENGIEVRSLEELKENFSLARVLGYFNDGKLVAWLRDRYIDDLADAVEALDSSDQELASKISKIFDVSYDEQSEEDLKKESERMERIKKLRKFTDEEKFVEVIDNIAFDQDELYDILDQNMTEIYLCGDSFEIPVAKKGVHYVGINNPVAVVVSSTVVDWDSCNIQIENVRFDEKYQKVLDIDAEEKGEQSKKNNLFDLFKEMRFKEFLEEFNEDEADDEAYYMMYRIYITGNIDVVVNDSRALSYLAEGFEKKFPICSVAYALMGNFTNEEKVKVYDQFKPRLQQMSDRGNILATHELGVCYINKTNEEIDYTKALEYFMKNMKYNHFWLSAYSIALRYDNGQGVERDYKMATDYYYYALEYGHISAYFYAIELYNSCIDNSELKLEKARKAFYKVVGLNAGKEVLYKYIYNRMWFDEFKPSTMFFPLYVCSGTYSSKSQAENAYRSGHYKIADDANRKFADEVDSYIKEKFHKRVLKDLDLIDGELKYCKQKKILEEFGNHTLHSGDISSMMNSSPAIEPCLDSKYYELFDHQFNGFFGGHEVTIAEYGYNYDQQWDSRLEYVKKRMPDLYKQHISTPIWEIIDEYWVDVAE